MLYELNHGETAFWESWGAIDENGVRQRCSYNHYAFGSVGHWLYTGVAGLRPLKAGCKAFSVQPLPDSRMTEAHLALQTIYGTVILPDGAEHAVGSGKYAFQCEYCMKEEK